MKLHKSNKTLQRVLHSRQLGLKLIANVTYGYTAASFSGRMACIEVRCLNIKDSSIKLSYICSCQLLEIPREQNEGDHFFFPKYREHVWKH